MHKIYSYTQQTCIYKIHLAYLCSSVKITISFLSYKFELKEYYAVIMSLKRSYENYA